MYDLLKTNTISSVCKTCVGGLALLNSGKKCRKNIGGCLIYDEIFSSCVASICQTCEVDYVITVLATKCMKKIPQCIKYN